MTQHVMTARHHHNGGIDNPVCRCRKIGGVSTSYHCVLHPIHLRPYEALCYFPSINSSFSVIVNFYYDNSIQDEMLGSVF